MDLPDQVCKTEGCTESRVNENHCARHTRKLHPLYLRYKDLERQLREAETELSDIPSLLRLYTLCARAYKLRQRYRDAMKSELRDQGHDVAIYRLLLRMRKLDQRLRELTKLGPLEDAPTAFHDQEQEHENEREDELPDNFTPEQALQFGANCRRVNKAYDNEMDIRMPCILKFNEYATDIFDKLNRTADRILQNRATDARLRILSDTPVGSDARLEIERLYLTNDILSDYRGSSTMMVACVGINAWRQKKSLNISMDPDRVVIHPECCVRRGLEILIRYPEFVDIAIYYLIMQMNLTMLKKQELVHRLRISAEYDPPVIRHRIYIPAGLGLTEANTSSREVPISAYEHPCVGPNGPRRTSCDACEEEIAKQLPYRTLPGHFSLSR